MRPPVIVEPEVLSQPSAGLKAVSVGDGAAAVVCSPRLWLGFLVVVVGLVAAVFFINNPDMLAPLQDATVAVLTPTEEPRTNTPVLTPTPKPRPTTSSIPTPGSAAEAEEVDQAQPRSQPVPSQTIESTGPTLGPTPMPSPEGHLSEAPAPAVAVPTSSTPPTPTSSTPPTPSYPSYPSYSHLFYPSYSHPTPYDSPRPHPHPHATFAPYGRKRVHA